MSIQNSTCLYKLGPSLCHSFMAWAPCFMSCWKNQKSKWKRTTLISAEIFPCYAITVHNNRFIVTGRDTESHENTCGYWPCLFPTFAFSALQSISEYYFHCHKPPQVNISTGVITRDQMSCVDFMKGIKCFRKYSCSAWGPMHLISQSHTQSCVSLQNEGGCLSVCNLVIQRKQRKVFTVYLKAMCKNYFYRVTFSFLLPCPLTSEKSEISCNCCL